MRSLPAATVLLIAAGCADRTDQSRYYPPEDKARSALEAGLNAWQQGLLTNEVPGTKGPAVMWIDNQRPRGQRLNAFEVLGLAPGDGPRIFTVRLVVDNPAAEVKIRFVVVGLDPIWVFRQEDYDMMIHWDHPMPKAP
jgi:hypothetical protein